jgi:hypothetical protein
VRLARGASASLCLALLASPLLVSAQGSPRHAAPDASSAHAAPPAPSARPAAAAPVAPSQEAKAAAQALFDEAMALRKQSASAEACAKLEESLRLDPAPGAKFYFAECMERAGKLASAWLLYTEVADAMAATGQEKREQFARERSAALAPKLARLQVVVPESARVPGLVVRRDRVLLGEAQWGFAVPVDPGSHTVEATAPGLQPFTTTVDVREAGSTVKVDIPALGSAASTPVTCATASSAASASPTAAPSDPPVVLGMSLRTSGLALGGVAALGFAAGAVLGGVAISKQNASNRGPCDLARDVCSPEGLALRADAITAATGSTIAFVASGVLLAAGVVLFALPSVRARRTAVVAHPGGLSVEGRW